MEELSVDLIQINPVNAYLYKESSVDDIIASIRDRGLLEPLVVDQNNLLISGHRRLLALQKLGIKIAPVIKKFYENDTERNKDVVSFNRQRKKRKSDIVRELLFIERGYVLIQSDTQMHLGGFEYQTISTTNEKAQELGVSKQFVTDAHTIVGNIGEEETYKTLDNEEDGEKSVRKLANKIRHEHKVKRAHEKQEEGKTLTDEERFAVLDWKIPVYTVWNYPDYDETFGKKIFGSIPPQIVGNLLYLYTKEGDMVLDPCVGGGMTIDVCKYFNRRCMGFDLTPTRDDIQQHDITVGLPVLPTAPNLIFFDPPYWKQAEKKYSNKETDLGNISLSAFYEAFDRIFREISEKYPSSIVALIIGMTKERGIWHDHAFALAKIMEKYGTFLNRIIVPYPTQVHGGAFVKTAQQTKDLLYLYRDLLIYDIRGQNGSGNAG